MESFNPIFQFDLEPPASALHKHEQRLTGSMGIRLSDLPRSP